MVALAAHETKNSNHETYMIVADEGAGKRASRKIPGVCKKIGISCCSLLEMLSGEFPEIDWNG